MSGFEPELDSSHKPAWERERESQRVRDSSLLAMSSISQSRELRRFIHIRLSL
jgi:hypothetical protein